MRRLDEKIEEHDVPSIPERQNGSVIWTVLESIFRNLNRKCFGLNIKRSKLNHLRFADDLVLFGKKPELLQKMIRDLNAERNKVGLEMNPNRQKWRWTGHMMRDIRGKWSKAMTEWYPRDANRSRGRQRRRWMNDIKMTAGHLWTRVAQDRSQ
ncbi:hypothetical protein EVAR_36487_1 [Eumeta japonica]|uniref:Uncharacterized protein n=1 Tax=Eumeta variegata TaxID=151549 RepID=A0A4C1WSN2_EUMVA|nr:hypothetical protein EVAR_36487_1 [Eumeta japonica]